MPALPDGEERGELVETGGFRVDRSRALDKLRSFRSETVGAVPLLVRAAVASGARSLSVEEDASAVTLSWDGAPFRPSFFGDPYGPLFTGSEERRAERWAGLSMLHAFGPGVRRVVVESGGAALSAEELERESTGSVPNVPRTVVRLELSGDAERLWGHPQARIDGEPTGAVWTELTLSWPKRRAYLLADDPPAGSPGALAWRDGAARGVLLVPDRPSLAGALRLYLDGVLAGLIVLPSEALGAGGRAEVPGLRLDASLASYSVSPETDAACARAAGIAREFLVGVSAEHARRMRVSVQAMRGNDWLRRLWVRRLEEDAGLEADVERVVSALREDSGRRRAEAARALLYDAGVTVWLRRLFADGVGGDALDQAPLALGMSLELVTAGSLRLRSLNLQLWKDQAVPEFWRVVEGR